MSELIKAFTVQIALGLGVLALSGCATITQGGGDAVSVITDPAGASCRLERDGTTLGVIDPTPGSLSVGKSADHITVTCSKEEFQDTAGILSSEFEGMTFGNILFGGLVGVGVDAASGAMHDYPESISITLIPESFETVEARDAFYARLVEQLRSSSAAAVKKVRQRCRSGQEKECERNVVAIEEERDRELARIEVQRLNSRIEPP